MSLLNKTFPIITAVLSFSGITEMLEESILGHSFIGSINLQKKSGLKMYA